MRQTEWGRQTERVQVFGSACSIAYNKCSSLQLWEPLARYPPTTTPCETAWAAGNEGKAEYNKSNGVGDAVELAVCSCIKIVS